MARIDYATLFGLLLCAIFLAVGVVLGEGSFAAFVDVPSIFVTVGGSLATVMICLPLKSFFRAGHAFATALRSPLPNTAELVTQLARMAETARQDGLLALEQKALKVHDPFFAMALQLTADGSSPEIIEAVLRSEMEAATVRYKEGKTFFDQLGRLAPAFGMIGTLLGLILMLGRLSDPDSLGPGMAVAMITTLYGSVIANCICLPIAEKLAHLHREQLRSMELVVRGVLAIQAGDGPRLVLQKLESFVPADERHLIRYRAA